MKLDSIKTAITSKLGRQILVGQKHSPTILFGAGVVGVVATAVMASRATLKLDEIVDETKSKLDGAKGLSKNGRKDYTEKDYKQDVVVIYSRTIVSVAKLYAPAIAVGALSVAALTGSHVILTRRNVALTAAYAALDRGFKDYRQRVIGEVGEEKERQLRYGAEMREIVMDTPEGPEKAQMMCVDPDVHSVYARFFDDYSTSWSKTPEYNMLFLKCQQNYANDMLRARGHVFLNEVYDMLGIDRTKAGAVVGWVISKDGDNFIDFGIFDGDDERKRAFVNGREGAILLDFNVDGVIYDKI